MNGQVYHNKSVLILGYGVTGQAVARFCANQKIFYWVWEDLQNVNASDPFFQGRLTLEKCDAAFAQNVFAVIPSPGAPRTHPLLLWAKAQNLRIWSELEWAASFVQGNCIGVTGTNGKSTTVKLIDELLKAAGKTSAIFGNYGRPLIDACLEPSLSHYVIEESSYQLEWIEKLHHKIAVCLNLTEDHLDRYVNIDDYRQAKENIFKNSTAEDIFIYNYDNLGCLKMAKASSAHNLPFSLVHTFEEGGFLRNDDMVIRLGGQEFVFAQKSCTLKGWHNLENMLAALISVLHVDCSQTALAAYRRVLESFEGLPHRVQWVHSENGVSYYDDSKATNVHSVAMALTTFDDNIVLIAGGRDKGGDYAPLKGLVKEKVKLLLLIGEAQDAMAENFQTLVPTLKMGTLANAVKKAKAEAKPGDVVLLSPACSSFDQFKNYHERGLQFQDCVKS